MYMLAAAQCPEVLFLYLVNCCVINSGKILAGHAKVFCRLCKRKTMEQVDVNDLSLQISQSREQFFHSFLTYHSFQCTDCVIDSLQDFFLILPVLTGWHPFSLNDLVVHENTILSFQNQTDVPLVFIKFLFLNVMPRTLQCIIFIMYAVAKRENGHSFMRPVNHITILVDTDASMIFQNLLSYHWHTRYLKSAFTVGTRCSLYEGSSTSFSDP